VGVGDRVLITGEYLAGHQTGEMRHVDHQCGAHLVGDLAHSGEVDPPRVCRVAGDQYQRLELTGDSSDRTIVHQPGGRIGAVTALVKHLAGDVGPKAVGEVPAGVQRHTQQPLVAEFGA